MARDFHINGEAMVFVKGRSDSAIGSLSQLGLADRSEFLMPLNKNNTRHFHKCLYGTILEKVTVLKRNDNQQQGTVQSFVLYSCRRSMIFKTGETLQGDMNSDHRTIWHIPRTEMDRVGINYFNPADRIVDGQNRHWQPESTTMITVKLFENHVCVDCLRVDPPR